MNSEQNPFRVPDARVADTAASIGEFLPEGRRVPAGNGTAWIGAGWDLFKRGPGVWIGIALIFLVIMALSMIPILGLLVALIVPVLIGGIMLGCKELEEGGELRIGHLFEGFSGNAGNLILVGAIYLGGLFVVGLAATLVGGGIGMGAALVGGGKASPAMVIVPMLLSLLVIAALTIPLAMAVWYAPALVVLHEVAPFEAMKSSFFVCIRNFGAFLVYGLVVLVLAIPATLLFGLGWLVLMPVLYASVYASYRDLYISHERS